MTVKPDTHELPLSMTGQQPEQGVDGRRTLLPVPYQTRGHQPGEIFNLQHVPLNQVMTKHRVLCAFVCEACEIIRWLRRRPWTWWFFCWSEGEMLCAAWKLTAKVYAEAVNCQAESGIPAEDWQSIMSKVRALIIDIVFISIVQWNHRQDRSEPCLMHSITDWIGPNRELSPVGPVQQSHSNWQLTKAELCVVTWIVCFSVLLISICSVTLKEET